MVIIHIVACQNNYLQRFSRLCNGNVICYMLYVTYYMGHLVSQGGQDSWVVINLLILGTFLSPTSYKTK